MAQELITIVVPVYNVERWLHKCISSIIHQTYNKLEILLIDDGSTDGSGKICDDFASSDNRIKVFHKDNGGLSDARNYGIDNAHGAWITFIDSDDYIEYDAIETLYLLSIKTSADIAVCQHFFVNENDMEIGNGHSMEIQRECLIEDNISIMKEYLLKNNIGTVAWGKLYKTSLFKDVRYPIGKYHEDVYTTYKLIAKCERVVCISDRKYYYRQREQSITQSMFSPKHLDALEGALEKYKFISYHYPSLKNIAAQDIIYACNICACKMIKSGVANKEYWNKLQPLYRLYGKSYLRSPRRFKIKLFTILGIINAHLLLMPLKFVLRRIDI